MVDRLPIDDILPALMAALRANRRAVVQAPPGAGKTTRVPLAMLGDGLTDHRIVLLEPRRLAARTAAARMAESLGEQVGQTIGFRIRGETKTSPATRIEVVTEGILTRMIQSDPSLDGVGALIFDEFHERSLNADLGLALALEVRGSLRSDLILVAMSATLDTEPVAALMDDAPVITSEGQTFPVETHWLEKPLSKEQRREGAIVKLIAQAAASGEGGILAFLPGEGEIRRVARDLEGRISGAEILPLYGALPFAQQRRAIEPLRERRKIVLATAIAETSLTIPDIRIVVDGGQARRARYDPGSGMSRLVTERVTRAEADQRRGRAGRVGKGQCFRLWTKGEEGALAQFPPAEIESADLASLALEMAEWGARSLDFLTPPPVAAISVARSLLENLGALEPGGRITEHGRRLVRMPLHPRLAHMLERAGKPAAPLAALLAERDPMRGAGADLTKRLDALASGRKDPGFDRIRVETRRLAKLASGFRRNDPAEQAALAYPDRIGLRRPGDDPRWLLSGGKGAKMDPADPLAKARLLVVTDTDGHPRDAAIRQALEITESALRDVLEDRIETVHVVEWSRREGRVIARIEERLGVIALTSRSWRDAPKDRIEIAMLEGVRQIGLSWTPAAGRFRARATLFRNSGHDIADMSDDALIATIDHWLLPHLKNVRTAADWKAFDLLPALKAMLDWDTLQSLDREVPAKFTTPLGRGIDIDYSGPEPSISLKLQEMFGVTRHPSVAGRPLRVTLLSPAGRPVQTTMDIPGFWVTSYADVRKDMRGRYPKHPWPEDPTVADPTLRARRRTK